MKYTFLGEEVELGEFTIAQFDEIQDILLGSQSLDKISGGEARASLSSFRASQYKAIEYGVVSKKITGKELGALKASQAKDVNELYEAIMKINGQEA